MNPALRVDRYLIFHGGGIRKLGWFEYALIRLGLKRTVRR